MVYKPYDNFIDEKKIKRLINTYITDKKDILKINDYLHDISKKHNMIINIRNIKTNNVVYVTFYSIYDMFKVHNKHINYIKYDVEFTNISNLEITIIEGTYYHYYELIKELDKQEKQKVIDLDYILKQYILFIIHPIPIKNDITEYDTYEDYIDNMNLWIKNNITMKIDYNLFINNKINSYNITFHLIYLSSLNNNIFEFITNNIRFNVNINDKKTYEFIIKIHNFVYYNIDFVYDGIYNKKILELTNIKFISENITNINKNGTLNNIPLNNYNNIIFSDINNIIFLSKYYINIIRYLSPELKNNKELILKIIKYNIYNYVYINKNLQEDIDIIKLVLSVNSDIFKIFSKKIQNDKQVVKYLLTLNITDYSIYELIDIKYFTDEEIIINCINNNICIDITDLRKNNYNIANIYIKHNPINYIELDDNLKLNIEFIILALTTYGTCIIKYIPKEAKNNFQIKWLINNILNNEWI